jgi:hypothetical protein
MTMKKKILSVLTVVFLLVGMVRLSEATTYNATVLMIVLWIVRSPTKTATPRHRTSRYAITDWAVQNYTVFVRRRPPRNGLSSLGMPPSRMKRLRNWQAQPVDTPIARAVCSIDKPNSNGITTA